GPTRLPGTAYRETSIIGSSKLRGCSCGRGREAAPHHRGFDGCFPRATAVEHQAPVDSPSGPHPIARAIPSVALEKPRPWKCCFPFASPDQLARKDNVPVTTVISEFDKLR